MLIDLLKRAGKDLGISIEEGTTDRAYLVDRIWHAYLELYESFDLPGSLREQTVSMTATSDENTRFTLPWYCYLVRGVKLSESRIGVDLVSIREYYNYDNYIQSSLTWRVLGTTALQVSHTSGTPLTVTFKQPVDERTSVTITGCNAMQSSVSETLVFEVGQQTKTTSTQFAQNQFISNDDIVTSITKDVAGGYDAEISDGTGKVVGFLPNSVQQSRHLLVAISDDRFVSQWGTLNAADVLFKTAPIKITGNNDTFPNNRIEEAIYWKLWEHQVEKENNPEKMQVAMGFAEKANAVMTAICNNQAAPQKRTVSWSMSTGLMRGRVRSPFRTTFVRGLNDYYG
jgi:hypothetical protein